MATYADIYNLRSDSALRNRVAVAAVVKAQAYLDEATPTAAEVTWALATLKNPNAVADDLLGYVLAANKSATVAQIQNASDAAIQTNVDAAVAKIVAGGS